MSLGKNILITFDEVQMWFYLSSSNQSIVPSQDLCESQDPYENPPMTKKIEWTSNFRDEEDIFLVEVWINTSMNPGNEKSKAYWKKITKITMKTKGLYLSIHQVL
jgi:hypothetical protein